MMAVSSDWGLKKPASHTDDGNWREKFVARLSNSQQEIDEPASQTQQRRISPASPHRRHLVEEQRVLQILHVRRYGELSFEAQIQLAQRAFDLGRQEIHPLAFLEGDDHVGRTLLHLCHDLRHVEFFGQFLYYIVQRLFYLRERDMELENGQPRTSYSVYIF
ncbi:hypothetical protein X777_05384 [Ooceraea biroi]|uniref:Uncharacterized protein n=1 Tax=Ooceraea biroi TaxID=2015173 RepID=A0A026WGQ9_OOCBI|nr:hypothetical protein X777_05384 [Ooceraea biroi]